MIAGNQKIALVCHRDIDSLGGVCGDGYRPVPTQAYLLNVDAASNFEPIDRVEAGQIFSASFAVVFSCFLLGRGIGTIVNIIKHRF